mmetsp:Transcript_27015/g.53891  ORF Transcript_27015/g.53891 Transcript_27015/m.53891 type:complete len:112 (-) Transcript_27015:67-402(-)
MTLPFNYEAVLDVLRSFEGTVVATFSGHTHNSGYAHDRGIHHVVVAAGLESPPPVETFAVVRAYEDRLEWEGFGDEWPEKTMRFPKRKGAGECTEEGGDTKRKRRKTTKQV